MSTNITMIQINGIDVYYMYDGEKYAPTFPLELVKTFRKGCGPKECGNCSHFGRWNGVIIGICANCATEYAFVYGPGFISIGREYTLSPHWKTGINAFDTYLKDVNLDNIGDKTIYDSRLEQKDQDEEQVEYDDCSEEYGIVGIAEYVSSFDCHAGYDSY